METMIHIGTEKESVIELKIAIMEILSILHCDELTKQKALDTLTKGLKIEGTMISDCTFKKEIQNGENKKRK